MIIESLLILTGGAVVGALALLLPYFRIRRENARMDEERQLLSQEKEIVVDFMHHLVEAVGEGLGREELFTSLLCF